LPLLLSKIKSRNEGNLQPSSITWTSIEEAVARNFCVCCEHLTELGRIFLDKGDIMFGMENAQGSAAKKYGHSNKTTVSSLHLMEMVMYIDQQHLKGHSVTNRKVRKWLRLEQGVNMSRRTVQCKLQNLGQPCSKVKPQKKTLGSLRLRAFRDISLALRSMCVP
jgi:hypothetical protein